MAISLFQYAFSCTLLFALFSEAHPSTPFEFLKSLQGSQKGDNPQGLNQLKQYLNKFGYINLQNPNVQSLKSSDSGNNEHIFDDTLESAIKTYQLNYHLKPTGILDAKTVSSMMKPRCGVSDITNGHSRMRATKKRVHHHHHHHHTVSHYQFFSGSPKWPADKTNLNYMFESDTLVESADAISRAFEKWAAATPFTFTRVDNDSSAAACNVTVDITIGFHSRDHGDGFPFDGPFGVLAHAAPPTSGSFHLDADEPWSIGPMAGHIDLETVALHEIGHLLGLEHSSVEGAIMFPSVSDGVTKDLHGDDVQGINELYHTNV